MINRSRSDEGHAALIRYFLSLIPTSKLTVSPGAAMIADLRQGLVADPLPKRENATIVDEIMSLRTLPRKRTDVSETVGFGARRQNGVGGREPDRRRTRRAYADLIDHHNGYRDRDRETSVEPHMPRAQEGELFPASTHAAWPRRRSLRWSKRPRLGHINPCGRRTDQSQRMIVIPKRCSGVNGEEKPSSSAGYNRPGRPSRSQMIPACAGAGLDGAFDCQVAFSVNQSRP